MITTLSWVTCEEIQVVKEYFRGKNVCSVTCLRNYGVPQEYWCLHANWTVQLPWHRRSSFILAPGNSKQTYPLLNKYTKLLFDHIWCVQNAWIWRGILNASWAGLSKLFATLSALQMRYKERWGSSLNTSAALLLSLKSKEVFSLCCSPLWAVSLS